MPVTQLTTSSVKALEPIDGKRTDDFHQTLPGQCAPSGGKASLALEGDAEKRDALDARAQRLRAILAATGSLGP